MFCHRPCEGNVSRADGCSRGWLAQNLDNAQNPHSGASKERTLGERLFSPTTFGVLERRRIWIWLLSAIALERDGTGSHTYPEIS